MPYPFDQIFAADPERPEMVATNAPVVIFAPGDETKTPLTLTALNGLPLENPIIVNDRGFGPAFIADLDQVAWEGGGLTGLLASYRGLKDDAEAAAQSATTSATEAQYAREAAERAESQAGKPADEAVDAGIARANIPAMIADNSASILAPEPSETGDDTSQLNTLLAPGKLTLTLRPGRKYSITDTLNLSSGTTLDLNGSEIDATRIPDGTVMRQQFGLRAAGGMGNSILVGTGISKWSRTISGVASTSTFSPGDLIRIRNFENPGPGGTKPNITKGELNVVASVNSASQITLAYGAIFDYANDGSLVIAKVNAVEDVKIQNGRLRMGGVQSAHTGITFQFTKNATIENVEIIGAEDSGVHFAHSWRGKVKGGSVTDSTSPAMPVGISGYGVTFEDCSRFMQVSEVQFQNCRSFVNGGGQFPASNVDIMWNQGQRAGTIGYGAHEPCYYWKFSHNTVIGGGGGIQFRGQHGSMEFNTIIDCPGNGIRFYSDEGITGQQGIVIRGNSLSNCGSGIVVDGGAFSGTTSLKRDVDILDNVVSGTTFDGILLRNFDGARIGGNIIDRALNNGINITGLSAASPSANLQISPNQIKNVTLAGIKIKWVNDVDLLIGTMDTIGAQGVLIESCSGTTTSGGSLRRATGNGIRILGGTQHSVNIGTIKDLVGETADAVVAVSATDVTMTGGIASGNRFGVYTSGCDRVIVSNVNAEGSRGAGGAKIRIEGSTTYRLSANIGTSNPAS